jgi:histidyl-tRNA synthetase
VRSTSVGRPGAPDKATSRAGLHARKTYKATKNIGKLLKDAADTHARFAVIIENATEATLKNLESGTQDRMPISEIIAKAKF